MNKSDIEPTTEAVKVPEIQLEIVKVIQSTGAEESTQIEIVDSLKEFTSKIGEWKKQAEGINVTSIEQKDDMKLAKESRLGLRSVRLAMTNSLKDLKADALKRCQGIDAVTRFIKDEIEPLEKSLKEHEDFEKRYNEEEKIRLTQLRAGQLASLGANIKHLDLGNMGEDDFAVVLQEAKDAKAARDQRAADAKAAAEKQAEEDRIEAKRLADEAEKKKEAHSLVLSRLERLKGFNATHSYEEIYGLSNEDYDIIFDAAHKAAIETAAAKAAADIKHQVILARQTDMIAVNGSCAYNDLAAMSDKEYATLLNKATEAHEAKAKADAESAAERAKAHRKVLSRQMAMESVNGKGSYDELASMDDDEFKAALKKATDDKAAAEKAAEKQKQDAADAEALRVKQKAADDAEALRLKNEAEERKKIQDSAVSSAAINAADILLETAETWSKRNPKIEGGKALFIAAAISHLKA